MLCLTLAAGCGDPGLDNPEVSDPDEITGANAVARTLTMNGVVYVAPNASDAAILDAVRTQTRTVFGPLRNDHVGLDDREVRSVDPHTFVREPVSVIDTDHPTVAARPMLRVRYTYSDRAVLERTRSSVRQINTTALAGAYTAYADDIIRDCTDDPEAREFGASGLWYMFNPGVSTCRRLISTEVGAIDSASRKLTDRRTQVSLTEVNRRFLPITATLKTIRAPTTPRYPEYDQLFGASDPTKTSLNIYAFFGVIGEREDDPTDDGYREMMFVLRNVLRAQPTARFEAPTPAGSLTDLRVNGTAVPNATPANIINWALGNEMPSGVDGMALRRAILAAWKARSINLTIPMTVTSGGRSHALSVKIHTYYGDEGSAWSQQAHQRYVDAWRDADVFVYSGHSHLGSGPLDPGNYRTSDFPNRYQIMMINSCVSYNYYNTGFYPLHPGGSAKLDMIVNGIEALGDNGHSVSTLITTLLNGRQQNYLEMMRAMIANEPDIGLYNYEPLRVVDGETDNTYSPSRLPITLAPVR